MLSRDVNPLHDHIFIMTGCTTDPTDAAFFRKQRQGAKNFFLGCFQMEKHSSMVFAETMIIGLTF
jgi:hypothetical protein